MNTLRNLFLITTTVLALANSGVALPSSVVPDARDQQVLQSFLSHLARDTNFNLTRVAVTNPPTIVLHQRTPEKTGFLRAGQIQMDLRDHSLPSEVEESLRTRNSVPEAKPDSYEAVTAFYTNLTFNAEVAIADLAALPNRLRSYRAFEEAYPSACGYVRAYLPGYSSDGKLAVVRANVGPTPHGATVTGLLEKVGETWIVKWYRLARYV